MDANARLELIRARFKQRASLTPKPKGLHCATTGEAPVANGRPKDRKHGLGVLLRGNWGAMERPAGLRYAWVKKPDPVKPIRMGRKRTKGVNHLTKIAEKWLHAPKVRAKVAP